MTYHLVTNSVAPQQVRETDEAFIIEDVPFIKPMQLSGGYVPRANIEKTAPLWDGVAVTLRHARDAQGQPIAASRRPDLQLGAAENPTFDGEHVRANIRISKDRLSVVEGAVEIREKLEDGDPIDVSSQYAPEPLEPGEYDGEYRNNAERIVRPDSVALLPEQQGQCSIADGCGIDPQLVANAEVHVPMTQSTDGEDMMANVLSQARRPTFAGTESTSWAGVDKTLNNFAGAVDADEPDSVADLSDEQRQTLAEHSLLGEADGDTFRDVVFFPVVNPTTGNLNEGALNAVLSGRGSAADIPEDALQSARSVARTLLEEEFDRDLEANAEGLLQRALSLLGMQTNQTIGAESPADTPPSVDGESIPRSVADDSTESDMKREKYINEITDNSAITADSLEDACDERVEQLHEDVVANGTDSTGDGGSDGSVDDDAIEQVANKLGEIQDQMVTEDEVEEIVANATEQNEKEELATEIVANSADYEDTADVLDDYPTTEALQAKRDSLDTGASLPGTGATANAGGDDDIDVSAGVFE